MSDYIFMLENHLNPEQNRVVEAVQTAAGNANVNVFLTGGAMRDMLGGFRIRDLDFSVEGNALKLAKAVAEKAGAKILSTDENRKTVELLFAPQVTVQIAMSRQEKYGKAGSKPHVSPATIQEDLRGRDFTVNAIALSLNKASKGLLLDPMNGLADLERRELRTVGTYGFYDDPVRMLRLVRFAARLGFTIEERTRMQFDNAREAGADRYISARALNDELCHIAMDDNAHEAVRMLDEFGLLQLFLPGFTGAKVPLQSLAKLDKAARIIPDEPSSRVARVGPFLDSLTEKLTPREKQTLVKTVEMPKPQVEKWQKLGARAKKFESALKSAKIRKPSHVYQAVQKAAPDEILWVLMNSNARPALERLRNYYEKYLPASLEVAPEEFAGMTSKPGTPKYAKEREAILYKVLDRRPKKIVVEEAPPPPPEPVVTGRGRGRVA